MADAMFRHGQSSDRFARMMTVMGHCDSCSMPDCYGRNQCQTSGMIPVTMGEDHSINRGKIKIHKTGIDARFGIPKVVRVGDKEYDRQGNIVRFNRLVLRINDHIGIALGIARIADVAVGEGADTQYGVLGDRDRTVDPLRLRRRRGAVQRIRSVTIGRNGDVDLPRAVVDAALNICDRILAVKPPADRIVLPVLRWFGKQFPTALAIPSVRDAGTALRLSSKSSIRKSIPMRSLTAFRWNTPSSTNASGRS